MLKATDLRERTVEDLRELEKTLANDVFQNRFKNFTNRLDDTSSIKKAKRDLARVKTILNERAHGLTPVNGDAKAAAAPKAKKASAPVAAEPTTTDDAPKAKAAKKAAAPKAEAKSAEKPAAAEKPAKAKKTSTKKTEG
jgi:large subunit ribosomal protein L29